MISEVLENISMRKALAYAAPAFALALVGIPLYIHIPKFYTDVVGVNIAVLGHILLGVRIFDAVTDPMMGLLSDKTETRFGRRRPYIAGGALALAVAMYLLFNPPSASPSFETAWFGIWIFGVFLFWTIIVVPYESLGPELTFDYDERTVLFGMRDGALMIGTLAAAASPIAISRVLGLSPDAEGERLKFFWLSVLYVPLIIGLSWWCVASIQERARDQESASANLMKGLNHVIRNRPFLILIAANTVSSLGNNLPAVLILYFVQYILHSAHAGLFLVLYLVTGIFFLPAWVLLARRWDKKKTWLAAMAVNTGPFFGVFFLGPSDTLLYGVLVFLSGTGFGATVALPSAMQADVIDYDELLSGARREGHYIGIWSITRKLAAAFGVGVALAILGYAGYEPNVEQSAKVQSALRILYCVVPCVCNLAAFIILLAYPLTRTIHEEIRAAIPERHAGRPVCDPLNSYQQIA
ncbi:MAG: MFS transporter [Candidatus Abyssubacteria bacterium]